MAAKKRGAQSAVTLKHLVANLSESHELSPKQAEALLGELVNLVTKHLKKGDRIRIRGLGTLVVRKRAGRMGRNPATVGTTPDGVKVLRPKTKPDHFTSTEIRKAVTQAKRAVG